MNYFRPLMILLALAMLWAVVARASASTTDRGDLISERSYLRDPGGALDIDSIGAQAFKPIHGPLGLGNKGVPTWLRLVVPAQAPDHTQLVLMLQPAALESLQIYLPGADGHGWTRVDSGSRMAFADRGQRTLNYTQSFDARTDAPTVIYVRIQTYTGTAYAQVLTPQEASDFDTSLHVGMGLYIGFALVMAALSASLWANTGRLLWGLAALFDITTVAHVSGQLGLTAKYVLPHASDFLPHVLYFTSATHLLTACLLWSQMTRMLELPRWVSWGYLSVVPFYLLCLPMILSGHGEEVLAYNNIGVLLLTLWGVPVLFVIRTPDLILRWLYRALNSVLLVYLLYFMIPILSASASSKLSLYPAMPTNLVSMVMVMALLARRTLLDIRMRQQIEREKLEVEQRYQLEQRHHAETSGMLGMIMHEMKNPLASIRVASELLSSGRVRTPEDQDKRFRNIQEAVDGIDSVLQRVIDVDRLEQGALTEERQNEDVAELLRLWLANHRQASRIVAELPTSLHAHIDARLMLLLLGNLVDNALKYSPAQSRINLTLKTEDDQLAIEVRNLIGRAGWPDPARLFQKYYRSPTAQHGSGTGLGLYWVSKVSEIVGGKVHYEPRGNEAAFILRMPK